MESPKIQRRSRSPSPKKSKRATSPRKAKSPTKKLAPKRLTPKKTTRVGKVTRNNIKGFTNSALKRLAYKAGVSRISKDAYDAMRAHVYKLLEGIIRDTNLYRESARRKTILKDDVKQALLRKGITYAG